MDDKKRGLYGKFYVERLDENTAHVERTDGKSDPGEKHHDCEYFLLDLHHDRHAIAALRGYILSCRREFPDLADDLSDKCQAMEARFLPSPSAAGEGSKEIK